MIRPLSLADEQWICENAHTIEKMFPRCIMPEIADMDYLHWSEESYRIAVETAYKGIEPGEIPSTDYLIVGEKAALRQIALSGYRLANLITDIFDY